MTIRHIAFVPASGVSKKIRFFGIKLPKIFSWRIFHFLLGLPGVKIKYTGELNVETLARLDRALNLYNEGIFQEIFVAGGYAKGIKYATSDIMKCYLANVRIRIDSDRKIIEGMVKKEDVFVGNKSSDSIGHAKELVNFLAKLPEKKIVLHVITSSYHMQRAIMTIDAQCRARGMEGRPKFERHPVKPPTTPESLFNFCIEPLLLLRDWSRIKETIRK